MHLLVRLLQLLEPPRPSPAAQALLLAVVIGAMVYDIRFRRIPNWLTVSGVLAGVGLNAFIYTFRAPDNGPGWLFALKGLGVAFVAYSFLWWVLHAVGAGDVKLMMAVAATVGLKNWLVIWILTAITGGIMALLLVIATGRFKKTLFNVAFILSEMMHGRPAYLRREELDVKSDKGMRMPHAVSIAVGSVFFVFLSSQ